MIDHRDFPEFIVQGCDEDPEGISTLN